jgi:DNA-binding IclR family transcriptional regulator
VAILRSFGASDDAVALAELARRTGIHKATTHRLCKELVALRLLDKSPSGYRLSGGLFEMGMRASVERSLLELAIPFLQDLYERTHETVHLGIREGSEVVYIAKIGGHRQARSPSRIGGRMPLHCTAIGKVLLAYGDADVRRNVLAGPLERRTPHTIIAPGTLARALTSVRRSGVAFEREESALGITCIAVPVFSAAGDVVAAVSITGPTGRFRAEQHATALRAAATALSNVLARRRELALPQ